MAGTLACLICVGVLVALKTGKMINLADRLTIFSRRDRPRYYWYSIALVAGLSAFCAYLAIFAPP
jgi:hypothetical protein